jgi:hypothetical protein
MNLTVAIYSAILFFVLSPGVLLRLPSNGSKMTVAGVHAIVFAAVLYFTAGFVWRLSMNFSAPMMHRKEGFEDEEEKKREEEGH